MESWNHQILYQNCGEIAFLHTIVIISLIKIGTNARV